MNIDMLAALSKLNPTDRELFVDSALCDRTPKELADEHGMSVQWVSKRIIMARNKLTTVLYPEAVPHGTLTGYYNWACRCDACRAFSSEYRRAA